MLARVAERVYWLSRYMERCENTARMVNVYSSILLDTAEHMRMDWDLLVDICGSRDAFEKVSRANDEASVLYFLLADSHNPASLMSSLRSARENSRITRDVMPMEVWEILNELYHHVTERETLLTTRRERDRLLEYVIRSIQQVVGLLSGCMSRNHTQYMLHLGRFIERADMTSRIVDAGVIQSRVLKASHESQHRLAQESVMWISVLQSVSAYQMYCQSAREHMRGDCVVAFLVQNREFPRAMAYCAIEIEQCLWGLPHHEKALACIINIQRMIDKASMSALFESNLRDYLDSLQSALANLHEVIASIWFMPVRTTLEKQRFCES